MNQGSSRGRMLQCSTNVWNWDEIFKNRFETEHKLLVHTATSFVRAGSDPWQSKVHHRAPGHTQSQKLQSTPPQPDIPIMHSSCKRLLPFTCSKPKLCTYFRITLCKVHSILLHV